MEIPADDVLAQRVRAGEQDAFVMLTRRYERSLLALIRSRLGPVDAVEDVLQETLVHAWTGLRVRQPRDTRAWLYQVARNRCSDYLRATERREHTVGDEALGVMVDRLGIAAAHRRREVDEIVEVFKALPVPEREALRSFYVDGFSIREIAARHHRSPGTIKRRLSLGRDHVRDLLGIADRRNINVNTDSNLEAKPFPTERPSIVIERLEAKASDVDMRELTWWFVVPELRDEAHWVEYQPIHGGSAWRLTGTTAMRTRRRAVIHGHECVEIEVAQRYAGVDGVPVPPPTGRHVRMWARLTDAQVEWLGVERLGADGTRTLYTFLDDSFAEDFGTVDRRMAATDYLVAERGGRFARREGVPAMFADGVFGVTVGATTVRCTRIVEAPVPATDRDVVIVAYVDSTGRTVLFRRYDGRRSLAVDESTPRHDLLPHAERLVIDGVTYVHSFDCMTAAACGAAD